ncbi:hydrocarbon degradation protein [Bremerella cremea]|uniref:Hydrocarbon degradation protein n=1 Tax=Blastopirellula marina TaxID=124 RepID=A0A2S8G5Y2_9BACT|nr:MULTISPECIES: outer membrane protein transport protein [Pirellulaceae]PQO39710.1 hydrocarbon degradation protein [Blastopirellula marina]RCS51177.1 hydrocarbon degradation protein [Bremerella cremea]
MTHRHRPFVFGLAFLALVVFTNASVMGQGMSVTGVGPVNRGMAGAGTAAPLDAIGALHWNPASISYLEKSEVSFGMEGLLADVSLTSDVAGLGTNTTSGEPGVAIVPSVGWVDHLEGTNLTIGMGVYGVAGFRNNMPADASNPLLASSPVFADTEMMQITPTVSYRINDNWSIGVSPTISAARMQFDPLGPSAVIPTSTPGSGNRVHWGGGVQGGIYYASPYCWRAGFTIKSPQWFEEFRFFTPSGVVGFDLDYPMILSGGLAYYGFERWVFAADFRYFDFANTQGFKALHWDSVFSMAVGAQYRMNELWTFRGGYNFNENPISPNAAFANLSTPLIQQHNIAAGLGCMLTDGVELNLAYVYLVNNSLTGPLPSPPFSPGDTLTHEISAHSLVLGLRINY